MANVCTYNMRIHAKKDAIYDLINNGLHHIYDSFLIDEFGQDDDYYMEIEGECRGSVTNAMIRERDDEPTLLELSKNLELEIEVFGYDRSEPEWIEHYHYNKGEIIKEYALPPYLSEYMVGETEVEIDLTKYTYDEDHSVYILKEEYTEKFNWNEEDEVMEYTFTMSFNK